MKPLTPDDRAAMRQRCDAAAPGKWVLQSAQDHCVWSEMYSSFDGHKYTDDPVCVCVHDATSQFIAASRTDLPACLDALDEKDKEIAELQLRLLTMEL